MIETLRDMPAARRLMLAIGVSASAALLATFASQHLLGLEPCPWCIVQRLIVIAIAVVAFAAAAFWDRAAGLARILGGAGVLVLSANGAAAAWYQHTVAAKQLSCSFTWADRFLMSLGLDAWWPAMFEVRATCADAAAARLLGMPFEWWSGGLFVLFGAAVVWTTIGTVRRGRRRVQRA
jgi:protein dithiol:quinone oxidoreductase